MYQSINIDKATEFLKNIIDSNRCAICDRSNGKRMRYPCGHTSCDQCVPAAGNCELCLTIQDSSAFTTPSIDEPGTLRCQNAISLLNAFQTGFNVDVYKRHRISEFLKVEKELFPQCIQAPAKYYNKRKSLKTFKKNKENSITAFLGEEVSSHKMENSNSNVREWLNKCVKRKPLGDLNYSRTFDKYPQKVLGQQHFDKSHRKRNHTDIWADENQSVITNDLASTNKYSKKSTVEKIHVIKADSPTNIQKVKNKDDSGISIGDEGMIIIDDSQSIQVDKDMNAWLAVLEAEKNAQYQSPTLSSKQFKLSQKTTEPVTLTKVPFYLKSSLCENCETCNKNNDDNDTKVEDQPNIFITVENKSFTAIINVSKAQNIYKSINKKQSVEVQTDYNYLECIDQEMVEIRSASKNNETVEVISPTPSSSKSKGIFLGEANNFSQLNKSKSASTNVIIAESDSDEGVEHSISLQVTADVHRSCDEIVLGDVVDLEEHTRRPRRAARGHTPASTDSSDKENFNPNREKKATSSKKKSLKK